VTKERLSRSSGKANHCRDDAPPNATRMTLQQTLTAAVRVSLVHMQGCLGDDTSVPGCKPSFLAGLYSSSVLPRPATLRSLPTNTSDNLACHQGIDIRSQRIRIARVWPSSYKTTAAMKPQRKQLSEDDRLGPPVRSHETHSAFFPSACLESRAHQYF